MSWVRCHIAPTCCWHDAAPGPGGAQPLNERRYTAESLGGYKVKDVAEMLAVPIKRVQYWVAARMLQTKGGRITEPSLSVFLARYPEKIPFASLGVDMQKWLREMGYPDPNHEASVTNE